MSNTQSPLKPLVKWSGGKQDEISHFASYLPGGSNAPFSREEMAHYIEPFAGGAATYFHLRPRQAILSDVHSELVDFYSEISKGNAQEIYNFMTEHPNDEDMYYRVRDQIQVTSPIENACRFYYLRKTCYRGMMRYNKKGGFNIPYGRYKTINYEELKNTEYAELLSGAKITCEGFEEIFARYDDPANFMFLDPPYDSVFTDYGYCKFGEKEHRKLAECFKTTKNKCLMIIGKTPLITELYGDYIVEEYEKKYKFKLHSGRVGDEINAIHVIIKNW